MTLTLMLKCTRCKKSLPATEAQSEEARDMGCYFSACCQAVATVDRVELKQPRARKAR